MRPTTARFRARRWLARGCVDRDRGPDARILSVPAVTATCLSCVDAELFACTQKDLSVIPGHFMNTMSTLEYNTPTLTQEYEYVGEVLLMSMSTQVRRDS